MATTRGVAPTQDKRTVPTEPLPVRVGALLALGLVIGVLAALWRASPQEWRTFLTALPWAGLVVVASVWPIKAARGSPYLALDLPVLLACAFVLGPFTAGVVALVASTSPQELRGQVALSRSVWNHAQVALSVMAAGVVFVAMHGDLAQWPAVLLAAEAALVADTLVNYVSVSLIYAVGSGRRFTDVLLTLYVGTPRDFAMFYAGLAIVAAVMATLYLEIGTFALVVFAVPILLARETLRQTALAADASRDLAARREALRLVDERIAQERADERNRIAAALHDDVLQRIFDVTLRAHVIRECYRRGQLLELEAAVPELIDSAERAAQEARDVIHGLRRSPIGHAGLIETLSLLIAHIADESGVKIVSELVEEPRLQPNVELAIYQIAREALVNASKHSQADTIWLALKRQRAGIELSVLDNGIGFDVTRRKAKHFGLEVMSERADAAGGSLAIQSSPGNGALVIATFGAP